MNVDFKMIEKYGKNGLLILQMLRQVFAVGKRLFFGKKRKQKRQGKQQGKQNIAVHVPVFLRRSANSPAIRRTKRLGRTVWTVKNRYF